MIKLHNYHELFEQREKLCTQRQKYYEKYFTTEDDILEEMLTKEDSKAWYKNKRMIKKITKLLNVV